MLHANKHDGQQLELHITLLTLVCTDHMCRVAVGLLGGVSSSARTAQTLRSLTMALGCQACALSLLTSFEAVTHNHTATMVATLVGSQLKHPYGLCYTCPVTEDPLCLTRRLCPVG